MDNVKNIILELKKIKAQFFVENGNLRIDVESGAINDQLKMLIKAHKSDIIDYIDQIQKNKFIDIGLAPVQAYYPLSSAQKRMFFLQEFAPQSSSYNMPMVQYLGREADKGRILAALKALIERHESLRTSFERLDDGVCYQRIHETVDFVLDEHSCDADAFASYLESYVRAFRLEQAPLLRSSLVEIRGWGYLWIVDMHHIISDGTSQRVLTDDFIRLYRGEVLPELRLQYKDFSVWQNRQISSGDLSAQEAYWQGRFSDGIPRLEFPADRVRPVSFTFEGGSYGFEIDPETTGRLRSFVREHHGTLQMGLLSVLNVLLYRYTGQQDIVIGTGIEGRRHADLSEIVGMFVNSLAIRSYPEGAKRFIDFYKEVVTDSIAAYEHQDVQFEDLVDMLKVERDPSRNPMFDIVLSGLNFQRSSLAPGELGESTGADPGTIAGMPEGSSTSKFDMIWFVDEGKDRISMVIEYYAAIYDASTISRLAKHFMCLLGEVLDAPERLLRDIPMLADAEKRDLLGRYISGEAVSYPDKTVIELFEEQAALTADHTAITYDGAAISYRELNIRANQLAHFLIGQGLQVEESVGILMDRKPDYIVSMLGIMKAGGMYVPMDPDMPQDRLQYMIEDAGISTLLTEKALIEYANRLQWQSRVLTDLICVDSKDIYSERGLSRNELMRKDLWDHVGDMSTDAITGGGWMSSYTGEYLSDQEMNEYSRNAYIKLKDHLRPDMRVLEIGCSSGLTMFQIAPEVGLYYGTDLSSSILSKTELESKKRGYTNIILSCMPADETDQLDAGDFDLVIINSVIQCFNGHNYLRDVLLKAIGKLKEKGLLFIGDIMDEDKRSELISDLSGYREQERGKGYRTKTDWSSELFVSRNYFDDLLSQGVGIVEADYSEKVYTIENELTKYRYDAILKIDKQYFPIAKSRHKRQHDLGRLNGSCSENTGIALKGTHLAYIIYTSGSTGVPKGVMIEHRSLTNLCLWHIDAFSVSREDHASLYAGVAFDASVWEFFPYIISGSSIYIIPKEIRLQVNELNAYYEENNITISFLPTQIGEKFFAVKNHSLRYLLTGGDKLNSFIKQDYKIVNNYGPTENTVVTTSYLVNEQDKNIPIGRPISNVDLYILDEGRGLLPVGVPGELCIGGAGLARGYLNRPKLTSEKFIEHPFLEGERLYCSGDIGRWLEDGSIEYLGRRDDQVKIRGYRIELGEIESALRQLSQIEDVVVVSMELSAGEKELVCYVVSREELISSELRAHLLQQLPSYMVPGHFVQLDKLPLTVNGKLDKRSLPSPLGIGMESGVSYVAARNATEEKLVGIWQEILGVDRVGVTDNFFDLGGHSLKATRLASHIHKGFGVRISLTDLFYHTEIESQAVFLDRAIKTVFKDIGLAPKREYYPLSSSQRRLWVLSQFDEGNVAYNIPGVYLFRGDIDRAALSYCFGMVVSRHEVLRTVFREDADGEIGQYIQPETAGGFAIGYSDFRGRAGGDQELKALIGSESVTAFDLAAGPLLRAWLYQVSDQEWVFTYTMHHIISDGWSMGILIRELLKFYNSYVGGAAFSPPALTLQYKDYAWWQQSELKGERFQEHRRYWLDRFSGDLPVLELSGDRVRPAIKTYNGGVVSGVLDAALTGSLKALTQSRGCTLFMGLLSAVNGLLYRYTGQEDIIIGSPIAGREHADLEDQIGFYVNTLALRTQFRGSESYVDLLDRVKGVTLDAYEHQSYPFDELVGDLDLKRDMSRNAIFDVMVVLQNNEVNEQSYAAGHLSAGGASISAYEDTEQVRSKFDLNFEFAESGEEVWMRLEYNSDIYDRSTAERMLSHVSQLLSGMVAHPGTGLQELDYLSQQEREQLSIYSGPEAVFEITETVLDRFAEQAKRIPDEIAVVSGDKSLTYGELDTASDAVAFFLCESCQIKPGDVVGMMLDRTEQLAVVTLGILKSGGIFLAIDQSYPEDRKGYILSDSGCNVLLTEQFYASGVAAYWPGRVCSIEGITSGTAPALAAPGMKPESGSFMIYTSGSTGLPKGMLQTHRCLFNVVMRQVNYGGFEQGLKVLQYSSVSFDVFIAHELFFALLSGGSLYIISEGQRKDLIGLGRYISEERISWLLLPVSALNTIVEVSEDLWRSDLALKHIVSAGEQLNLSKKLITYLTHHPDIRLHNFYGPSETHNATNYTINSENGLDAEQPIGRPSTNTWVYILSPNHQLVPLGVPGELYISGAGLALGYINQAELTSDKFIANPYLGGERMYKTGDQGKWLAGGNIMFMGRLDDQVKIRGYRVELGEIENKLLKHPEVHQCAVVAVEESGIKELVGYVVSKQELGVSDLRSFLLEQLPEYMVPGCFIKLSELPLNSNGKIDKKKLPDPKDLGITWGAAYVAARNATEEKLVGIWQEILGVDRVGVTDNFFDLGGHSLKAVKMISLANRVLEGKLTVKNLFNYPVISELVSLLENPQGEEKRNSSKIDLVKESAIEIDLGQIHTLPKHLEPPQNILITGATGFVGAYLLKELLDDTNAKIYCLVRGNDIEEARIRIINTLKYYDLDIQASQNRIIPVLGDLSKPNLGITATVYQNLAVEIDYIYNAGAYMDLISSYHKLKDANATANVEIIKLAISCRLKKIIYISTLSIFSNTNSNVRYENDPIDDEDHLFEAGYTASKWVGEKILIKFQDKGLPIQIFRLGLITGDNKTGRMPKEQWFPKLLQSCYDMGFYPDGYRVAITPVDFVAKSIVNLSFKNNMDANIFHLTNPQNVNFYRFFENIEGLKKNVLKMSGPEWIAKLQEISKESPLPVTPFINFDSIQPPEETEKYIESKVDVEHNFSTKSTLEALKKSNISFPDETVYIKKYLMSVLES